MIIVRALSIIAALAVPGSLTAQTSSTPGGCEKAEAPTPVEKGPNSGTQNMGSTGWSGGGLGGSYDGTTPSHPLPNSKSDQPETAQGLDPTKPSPKAGQGC